MHDCVSRWSWRVSVWSICFDWREVCQPSWCNRKHGGRVSQRYRFESLRGEWALFSSCRQLYLSSFSDTHTHTHGRARAHTHTHTHTHTYAHTHTLNIVYIHTLRYTYNRNFRFPSPNSSADQELNILFLETSAKSGQNVTEAFHNVIRLVI